MKPIIAVPAVLGLVYRAYSRKSLTPLGITAAFLTAIAHAVHPWSAPFFLLAVFYLGGTKVTKVRSSAGPIQSSVKRARHLFRSIVLTRMKYSIYNRSNTISKQA